MMLEIPCWESYQGRHQTRLSKSANVSTARRLTDTVVTVRSIFSSDRPTIELATIVIVAVTLPVVKMISNRRYHDTILR